MNKKLRYKLDNTGIVTFVVGVIVIIVGNVLFSDVWNNLVRDVFYDVVICLCSSLFGPILGALTGFLGVVCGDVVNGNGIVFGDAVSFAVQGLFIGSYAENFAVRDGEFNGRKPIIWLLANAMGVIASLFFVKPFFDYIVYNKDMFDSLRETGIVALISIIPVGILIALLLNSISTICKKLKNK